MINSNVKKLADSGDLEGLHYIFVDSLDADPTFENYIDSYEYCKQKQGFFEEFKQITPLRLSPKSWDIDYWYLLKKDLLINFSEKRFSHMRKVAAVIFSEKIKKLEIERQKENIENSLPTTNENDSITISNKTEPTYEYSIPDEKIAKIKEQNEKIRLKAIEEEKKYKKSIEHKYNNVGARKANASLKKVLGITIITIVVILLIVELTQNHSD